MRPVKDFLGAVVKTVAQPAPNGRTLAAEAAPHPAGHFDTVFETPEWRRYVEANFHWPYAPQQLALASGRQITIASYVIERRFGNWEVLYSVPPYYYGSLRADGSLTGPDLAEIAHHLGQTRNVHSLTLSIHPLDGCAEGCEAEWRPYRLSGTATHILDLPGAPQPVDETIFSRNQRKKIRKALARGVTVTRTTDPAAVQQYYPVYLDSAARWGLTAVEPLEALVGLQRQLAPYYTLWLAHAAGQVIGGLLILSYGATAWAMHGSSLAAKWDLYPNNLLYSRAIMAACVEGRRYFDFLPSNRLPGVEAFKESLGAHRRPFTVYRIPNTWYAAARALRQNLHAPSPGGQANATGSTAMNMIDPTPMSAVGAAAGDVRAPNSEECQLQDIYAIASDLQLSDKLFNRLLRARSYVRDHVNEVRQRLRWSKPVLSGAAAALTPREPLKAGDIVQVLSLPEIRQTLDEHDRCRGMKFLKPMAEFCGGRYVVLTSVRRIYDERHERTMRLRNTVLLRDVLCHGLYLGDREGCDRCCFFFWKEDWLRKVESGSGP